jgi:hypothetical protein
MRIETEPMLVTWNAPNGKTCSEVVSSVFLLRKLCERLILQGVNEYTVKIGESKEGQSNAIVTP